jgi:RNA polymerase sigma-70 factor (ECF subfamily)
MSDKTDRELVMRTLAGNDDAFDQLVERHRGVVLSRIASRIAGYHDRQDVAQQVFLRAHTQLARLRKPERLSAWLGRIADNACRQWYRRDSRQLEFCEDIVDLVDVTAKGSQNAEAGAFLKARLGAALSRVSAPHRDVIVHHYVHNLSYQQTALQLGCDMSTVRSRMQKARNQIRKEINNMKTMNETPNLIALDRETACALRAVTALCAQTARAHPERRVLHGALLEKSGAIVATDGRRLLVRHSTKLKALEKDVIVDNCAPEDFEGIEDAELAIGVSEALMRREGRPATVFPLQSVEYPKYRHVIPTSWIWRFRAHAGHLREMCDEIAQYLTPQHAPLEGMNYVPLVRIALDGAAGILTLSTSKSLGYSPSCKDTPLSNKKLADAPDWEHSVSLRGETENNGSPDAVLVIHMNFGYWCDAIDGLGVEGSRQLDLQFTGPENPVVVRPTSNDHELAVLMPHKVA